MTNPDVRIFWVETQTKATGISLDRSGVLAILTEGRGLSVQLRPEDLVQVATAILRIHATIGADPQPIAAGDDVTTMLLDLPASGNA